MPPPCGTHLVLTKSQYVVPVYCCWARENNKKSIATHIGSRLLVAILHSAETWLTAALPAPPWQRPPPLLLARGQVVAVRAARLEL